MVSEQEASSTPIETRLADDGVGYTWAEFEYYYEDATVATEMWAAAQVVVAPQPAPQPNSSSFVLGSIVRVLADTTPGVRPMHAEGILVAKVLDFAFDRALLRTTDMVWPP